MAFTRPFPDDHTLRLLYDSVQYQSHDRGGGDPRGKTGLEIAAEVERERFFYSRYERWLPPPGPMLDVGAGWGMLMKYFQTRGWDVHGVEISSLQADFAGHQLGLAVHQCGVEELDSLNLPPLKLVVLRHTLEHFRDPRAVLANLRSLSAPRSIAIVEVPDYRSYDRRAYGDRWPAFGPWHLWYFSRPSLARLLNDVGYEPLHYDYFLSERIFGNKRSRIQRFLRRIANRLGAKRIFSGRNLAVVARRRD